MRFLRAIKQGAGILSDFEIWPFSLLVILSIFSEVFLPFTIAYGIFFWHVRWVAFGRPSVALPSNLPIFLLLLTIVVSIYATPLLGTSMPNVLRLLSGILFYFSISNWAKTQARIKLLLFGFLALGFLLGAVAIIVVNFSEKFAFLQSILANLKSFSFTSSVHPNVMGGNLILFLIGILAISIFRWYSLRIYARIGLGLIILFLLAILILTQSRGALIALALGLCLLTVLKFKRGWIPITIILVVSMLAILQIGPQRVWNSIASETGGAGSLASREEIWMRAKIMLQDFPLTGIGMGTYGDVADTLYPFAHVAVFVSHAHNLFMQIGLDLGLPGLITWLSAWIIFILMSWQLFQNDEINSRAIGAAGLCIMAGMGIHGLMDAVTWDTRPAIIVWGIWGLISAEWIIQRQSRKMGEGV